MFLNTFLLIKIQVWQKRHEKEYKLLVKKVLLVLYFICLLTILWISLRRMLVTKARKKKFSRRMIVLDMFTCLCNSKTTNFNLMARVQSLEKERDEKVEVKNEVIKCLEKKTVEDTLVLVCLISDFC